MRNYGLLMAQSDRCSLGVGDRQLRAPPDIRLGAIGKNSGNLAHY
jgi:hypothetical protein